MPIKFNIQVGGAPADGDLERENSYSEIWKAVRSLPLGTDGTSSWIAIRDLENKVAAKKVQMGLHNGKTGVNSKSGTKLQTRVRQSEIAGDTTYVLWLRKVPVETDDEEETA